MNKFKVNAASKNTEDNPVTVDVVSPESLPDYEITMQTEYGGE